MIINRIRLYWPCIKSLQTSLLLFTGLTGYISARCPVFHLPMIAGLLVSLFLTVSGSTILNMVYDRDIDGQMKRTYKRPLPSGLLDVKEAMLFGVILSVFGIGLSFWLSPLYAWIIFAGWFLDVIVYTFWLKRRTPWSILWGGLSGGMPVLAGRVLGTGHIDLIGILLAIAVVLWIPTHIMTFNIRYHEDYQNAGVPTFLSEYGIHATRFTIALSAVGAAAAFMLGCYALGLAWGYLRLLGVLTVGIVGLASLSLMRPSEKTNFALFKFASLYMLSAMLLILLGVYG